MNVKPRAVYITPSLGPWLEHLPAEVTVLNAPPGLLDLPAELAKSEIVPDVIFQDELLTPRTLVKGLEQFDCPKVFWTQDPHLNHYWQAPYASLFGAVACTQKAWLEPFRQAGAGKVGWVTWCERFGPCIAHSQRGHPVAFVGRVTQFRPVRRLFVEYLQSLFPIRVETEIPYGEVQSVYSQTRLAPNESIQGEITQRLFAAAAVGCLVLEPHAENGLEELFEPGREVVTYSEALELGEVVRYYLKNPELAEKIGRAAWERTEREHRPENRVQALWQLAMEAPPAACGLDGKRQFWLAAARCLESSLLPVTLEEVLAGLQPYQDEAECFTAILRLLVLAGQSAQALALAARNALAGFAPTDVSFRTSACALALRQGELGLARSLFTTFQAATGSPVQDVDSPASLYAAMAETLARNGLPWRPGFPFDSERHLPATASECYTMSLSMDAENPAVMRKAEALLKGIPGSELARMGYLSQLSLRNREDFLLSFSLGLVDLKTFRVPEGLEELRLARAQAAAQGKSARFERMLAAQDPKGLIRASL
ncbi:MAG: glycosyltransferase family 1 protein [Desulfovibrio sp.]|nr:glycosyltransferase family 1 protein [Desulfovibrio sp.]MBI4959589.1 glycosyltransferase family 1 protein [Desulfovibrio sp.]